VHCEQASDCSWLYFDQGLLEPIFAAALKRPQEAHQLPCILAAFMDAQQLLQHAPLPQDRAGAAPRTQVICNDTNGATACLATEVACKWLLNVWAALSCVDTRQPCKQMLLMPLCKGTIDQLFQWPTSLLRSDCL